MQQQVEIALIGLIGVGFGSIITYVIAERRLRAERSFDRSVEALLKSLLSTKPWKGRTFSALSRHCKGVPEDELRQKLLSIGAVCLTSKDGEEVWGLVKRVKDDLQPFKFKSFGSADNQ